MCFQRDSNKDKIIVWAFIVGTVGLLGWAAFKKVVAMRQGGAFPRQSSNYAPMQGNFR
jgi:predicted negative regulator of RcsB-dependent stress response